MEKVFNHLTKTGDIVIQLPQASPILRSYRIDFCCGGNRPIGEVLKEKRLSEEEVLGKLNQLYEEVQQHSHSNPDWTLSSSQDLIYHIIHTHHHYLMKHLPDLSTFVTKIFRVHGSGHPELAQVHRLFHEFKMEMEQHALKEEDTSFPLILKYEKERSKESLQDVRQAILQLEQEHEAAGNLLEKIREITLDYTLPEDACTTYQLTFKKLEELEEMTFEHIHLENNILFRRYLS